MTIKDDIFAAVTTAQAAAQIISDVANGPASGAGSTVATEAGPVRSVAKAIADIESEYAAADVLAAVDASLIAAELARAGAEDDAASASASAAAAAASAIEAAGIASTLNLPSAAGHGLGFIRQKADESGFEYRTPAQVLTDIGGQSASDVVLVTQGLRDQLALTNLRLLLGSSVSSGALAQGYQWELVTDEWASGSSNYTFTAGSPGAYYTQTVYGSNVLTGGTASASGSTMAPSGAFDGNFSTAWFPGTGSTGWIVYDLGAGVTKTFRKVSIYHATASGYNANHKPIDFTIDGSNNNSTWTTLATVTGETWTGSGEWKSYQFPNSVAYRHLRVNVTNSLEGPIIQEIQAMEAMGASNMTLLSPAVSVSSAPSFMGAYFLWKDDNGSAVLGTDLTVELSRDGGTTWTLATLTTVAAYDGSYSLIKARADVSGQPAGTAMKARIKTLNLKAQRVAAPALYKE